VRHHALARRSLSKKGMRTHLLRLGAPLLGLVVFRDDVWLGVVFALAAYLGAFAFTHDVAHGALGLKRRLNEWVLTLAALPMLVSGHSMRLMHMRHHARPLAADDVEGAGAATTLWKALGLGPINFWTMRVEAWRAANVRERKYIALETVAGLGLAALALAWPAGRAWLVVCVVMTMTATAWASHLPHHPPRWMRAIALRLAWTGSAVLLSFAFHDAHHARPKVPCAELAG
jgi:fatty acid desaturase